ncbi:MAG: sugar phosphate isomerase/epimerase [Cyclobacteriaceae bacterium]
MFKISVLFADSPIMDPLKIAPGFEASEIPLGKVIDLLQPDAEWPERKREILSWGMPHMKVSSHWLNAPGNTPDADWELLEYFTKRSMKRLGDLGVKTAGIYGKFFRKAETTKMMDDALKYANMIGDEAVKNNMNVVLEPMADPDSLFPTYAEGLKFVKELGHADVKLMADLNYFLRNGESFNVLRPEPEWNLHCHIAGKGGGQPNVGGIRDIHKDFFRVLRDTNYEGAVSCACPWVNTGDGEFDLTKETAITIKYLQDLREEVYSE